MEPGTVAYLVSRLVVSGLCAFLAIVLWSRTRDVAWMLIVIGAIASYADILFDLLARFGLLDEPALAVAGLPLARMIFSNLPFVFLSCAFLVMIVRKRLR